MPRPIAHSYLQSYAQDEGALHVHVYLVHVADDGNETTEYVAPPVMDADVQRHADARKRTTWDQDDIVAELNSRGYTPLIERHPRATAVLARAAGGKQ